MEQHQSHVSKEVLCCQGQKETPATYGVTVITHVFCAHAVPYL
jgi:hypothetical protein